MTELIVKATILLAAAGAAHAILQKASGALRHFLWTAVFAALLLLPLALAIVPKWRPKPIAMVARVESATVMTVHGSTPAPKPSRVSWPILLWTFGCAVAATRFLAGAMRTSRMVRRASEAVAAREMAASLRQQLSIARNVRILETASAPMPLTWGILRPVVLLPETSHEWPAQRLHAVLLHELIHVRRWDLLAQTVAQAACCFYWFHPLAWLGLRQQRQERERACDDGVLLAGIAAHEYAAHLLELVRGMAGRASSGRWADAPAMAEASGLELRVRDLLRPNRNRRPLTGGTALAATAGMAAIFLPLAALTALAQGPMSGLSGTVRDPSGAVVPGCTVTAKNASGSNEETAKCDAVGVYNFPSIPSGEYTVEVIARGFKKFSLKVPLQTGTPAQVNAMLQVGDVTQSVTVQGQGPASAVVPSGTPQRIKVGGNVQAAMLISQVRPEYPADLQQAGVKGVVKVRAIIGKDGSVLHAQVVSTADSRLAQLALDAVNQWRYQPTLLNGEPVEILTTIDIDFALQGQ